MDIGEIERVGVREVPVFRPQVTPIPEDQPERQPVPEKQEPVAVPLLMPA